MADGYARMTNGSRPSVVAVQYGPGIESTSVGGGILHSLGYAEATDALSLTAAQTALWMGQSVDATSVLVKYTYGGDANLDGKIDISDYGRIDFNIPLGVSGWFNGDFNYDGKIDISDYGIIDFNVGIQGAQLLNTELAATPRVAGLPGTASVPEPASLCLLLTSAFSCYRRRRRRVSV